jgi:hypothetical protein
LTKRVIFVEGQATVFPSVLEGISGLLNNSATPAIECFTRQPTGARSRSVLFFVFCQLVRPPPCATANPGDIPGQRFPTAHSPQQTADSRTVKIVALLDSGRPSRLIRREGSIGPCSRCLSGLTA